MKRDLLAFLLTLDVIFVILIGSAVMFPGCESEETQAFKTGMMICPLIEAGPGDDPFVKCQKCHAVKITKDPRTGGDWVNIGPKVPQQTE